MKKLQQPTSSTQEYKEQPSPAEKHTSDVRRPLIHSEDLTWDSKSDPNAEAQSQTYSRRTNNGNIFTPTLLLYRQILPFMILIDHFYTDACIIFRFGYLFNLDSLPKESVPS